MTIVLDTNVLVSGLLNPRGAPGRVVELVATGDVDLAVDDRILDEYVDVLARREFGFDKKDVDTLVAVIDGTAVHVHCARLPDRLPDADDEPFLEAAIAAHADALVTGNLRHFPARLRFGVDVIRPTELLSRLPPRPR